MYRVVTLTTDFGSGSGYVAELKGRLLHAAAPFTLVDIAHDVPPHDIRAAAWLVAAACPAFPSGSLHLIVVDPGVGTTRGLVWARLGTPDASQDFLCPDNGVLTLAMRRSPLVAARRLDVPPAAAATFHGRDVLAPTAARLLDGTETETLGPEIGRLVTLDLPEPVAGPSGLRGEVVHVDAFGNLITNLPAAAWPRLQAAGRLRVGDHDVTTLVRTYGDAPAGSLVALVGSQGVIEVAVVEGRADTRLAVRVGAAVSIT
ncbi:MAG: Adenosyl-chloride synthase [Planctomycetota bacterium]